MSGCGSGDQLGLVRLASPPSISTTHAAVDGSAPVQYAKHMTHHILRGWPLDWVTDFRNILLIRDPAEVVASYVRSREACDPEDIGLLQQVRLLDALPEDPPIIDAGDFLREPEGYSRWICDWLGIDFTDRMLAWPAGDVVWEGADSGNVSFAPGGRQMASGKWHGPVQLRDVDA